MKTLNILTTLALFAGVCTFADEAPGTNNTATALHNSMNRSMDEMSGRIGAGLVVGEPTGPTVKYFLNDIIAIDATMGWSLRDDRNIYVNADILWHDYDLIQPARGRAAVYFGVGPSLEFRHNDDNRFGVRGPIGVVISPGQRTGGRVHGNRTCPRFLPRFARGLQCGHWCEILVLIPQTN